MVHVEKSNSLGKNNTLKKVAIKTEYLSLELTTQKQSISLSLKVDNAEGGTTRGSRPHDSSHPCLLSFSLCC